MFKSSKSRNLSGEYVQYGCGWSAPEGWLNFDASPTLRFERIPIVGKVYTRNTSRFPANVLYGDIISGLPVADNSCDAIYCSHVLEHLSLVDFRVALINTHRKLKNGGKFRLVIPDFEYYVNKYINDQSVGAALSFMQETGLGQYNRERDFKSFLISWLGNSRHLWMWDYKSIELELKSAGFSEVRRAYFGDSVESRFCEVEEKDRWEDCLGVECVK